MRNQAALDRAYPLSWPDGMPRAKGRKHSQFSTYAFARVRDELLHELRLLGAKYIVLSSNIPLRQDGLPYSGIREPDDPGIAVYFDLAGQQRCMACDTWKRSTDNVHALTKTIEALRGIARWGSTEMVERAFSGFTALPPAATDWRSVFGFNGGPRPTLDDVMTRYRSLAIHAHPDQGGSHEAMAKLNIARAAAEKELT